MSQDIVDRCEASQVKWGRAIPAVAAAAPDGRRSTFTLSLEPTKTKRRHQRDADEASRRIYRIGDGRWVLARHRPQRRGQRTDKRGTVCEKDAVLGWACVAGGDRAPGDAGDVVTRSRLDLGGCQERARVAEGPARGLALNGHAGGRGGRGGRGASHSGGRCGSNGRGRRAGVLGAAARNEERGAGDNRDKRVPRYATRVHGPPLAQWGRSAVAG